MRGVRIEDRIDISAPSAVVWDLTTDVETWPTFSPTMTRIDRLDIGPLMVGSQARVKQPGQRAAVWTVTAVTPGRSFTWTTRALGVEFAGTHEVVPVGDGCTNVLVLELRGRAAPVLGRLLAPVLRRAIRQENAGFKARAEAPRP